MLPAEPFQRCIDLQASSGRPCWVFSFSAYSGVRIDARPTKLMRLEMTGFSVSALPPVPP